MTRVGGVVGGDAVAEALTVSLQVVAPHSGNLGVGNFGDEDGTEVVVLEERLLYVAQVAGLGTTLSKGLAVVGGGTVALGGSGELLVGGIEHQPGNLGIAELGGKVRGTLLEGQTPVLVFVELAITVEILELIAVFLEELHTRCGTVA